MAHVCVIWLSSSWQKKKNYKKKKPEQITALKLVTSDRDAGAGG